MLQTSLNIFDLGVLIILGLSALLSFFRGFAREIISLCSWIGASIVTLYCFPTVSKWIEPQVKNAMIASGLASIGVFVITLIFISIVSGILIKFIKPSKEIGFLDNMLGLMFGVGRGILLVSIGYFIMTIVLPPKEYPEWVKDAATRPYVEKSAHYIAKLTPTYIEEAVGKNKDMLKDKADKSDKKSTAKTSSETVNDIEADLKEEMQKVSSSGTPVNSTPSNDHSGNLPSFEELQRRIRTENGSK